jgi:exopolysaccharide biosynthesis polyprenyl glycosylphosphotransferase
MTATAGSVGAVAATARPAQHPGVVHTRLQQRRPIAVRRHAVRTLGRLGAVLLGDLAAIAATVAVAQLLGLLATRLPHTLATLLELPLASVPVPHFTAAVLVALVVTGSYGDRAAARVRHSLLRASALAVTLTYWDAILAAGAWALLPAFLFTIVLCGALLDGGRRIAYAFLDRVWPGIRGASPAVLIGPELIEGNIYRDAAALFGRHYRFVGHVAVDGRRDGDVIGGLGDLPELIHEYEIETIVVGGSLADDDLAHVLDVSLTAGCELLYPARALKFAGVRPKLIWRQSGAFLELGAPVLKAQELLAKRVLDIVGAAAGLLLLAPLFLLFAAALKLDSPGPVFFTQPRAGLGGRRFRMLKFRTMRVGADDEKGRFAHLNHTGDARLFKIPNDPRVTRLGAWLRRWSLDELPQLWNVLRGEMSLVGPRPFFEADLEAYEDHHFRRLSAKPGITGLWQVSGRSTVVDFEEVVRLDREYIERWSVWFDLYILARTVPAVLARTGAY